MGRYSLNVRPQYGPNEDTGPERLSKGIGSALGAYAGYQDANREEENAIAAQGGVRQPDAPGAGGRIGQLKNYIRKKVFGQTDPGAPAAPTPTPSGIVQAGAPAGGAWDEKPPLSPSISSAIQSSLSRTPAPPAPAGAVPQGLPAMPGGQQPGPFNPQPQGPAAAPAGAPTPVLRTGPGQPPPPAAGMSPPAMTIGQAIQPYAYRSRSGATYTMDPMRASNIARQEKAGVVIDEQTFKEGVKSKSEEDQIAALTAAGMDPKLARAKVLTGTVKYDETYGQKPRGSTMTVEQRNRMMTDTETNRKEQLALQKLILEDRRAGRDQTEAGRQRTRQLAESEETGRNLRATMAADESEVGRAGAEVGKLAGNPVVGAMPGGQATIDAATERARAAQDRAAKSRAAVAEQGKGKKPVAERDAELKAQGMNAATRKAVLLNEGYQVHTRTP